VPQQGLIYRVLVASPSDCVQERRAVPEVIHYWNSVHARATGAILEPVLWETHARPELGDRPQGIINKQLVEISDILVGTFWTRLGTSTGVAESGTVEEIEEFRRAGKPVLLYFSSAPAVPESIDPEQFKALLAYKSTLQDQGLLASYDSIAQLREQLFRHLTEQITILHGSSPRPGGAASVARESESERALQVFRGEYEAFLRRLEAEWNSERDSEPYGVDEGRFIASKARAEVLNFRSQIVQDRSGLSAVLDEAARRLRGLERYEVYIDGGVSFGNFWKEGNDILALLKTALPLLGTETGAAPA
jgi:hypothetical protein